MRRVGLIALLVVGLLAWRPLSAEAGKVTGVTVSPIATTPGPNGTDVFVTVSGELPCSKVTIDYGEGSVSEFNYMGNYFKGFPFAVPTTYYASDPNPLTVTVKGVSADCQSQVSTQVCWGAGCPGGGAPPFIEKSLVNLCLIINCPPIVQVLKPEITQIWPQATPGGIVVITGKNFGKTPGELYLLATHFHGYQSSFVVKTPPGIIYASDKPDWYDFIVGGLLPKEISGLQAQTATLYLKAANGYSTTYPVDFKPAQEIKVLPASEVSVDCSDEADFDTCNDWNFCDAACKFCWGAPFVNYGPGTTTFNARHWTCVGSSSGTDSFSANLKNGWVLYGGTLVDVSGQTPQQKLFKYVTMSPEEFPSGVSSTTIKFDWTSSGVSSAHYGVDLYIRGGKGVPFK